MLKGLEHSALQILENNHLKLPFMKSLILSKNLLRIEFQKLSKREKDPDKNGIGKQKPELSERKTYLFNTL